MEKFKNIIKGVSIASTIVITLCSALGSITNSVEDIKQLKSVQ